MVLDDKMAYHQVIGSLMHNTLLLLDFPDLDPMDFGDKVARICFIGIRNLYTQGATKLTVIEIDQEIETHNSPNAIQIYRDGGLELLKEAYEVAEPSNVEIYYKRIKKYALLRQLRKEKYDISDYYVDEKECDDILKVAEIQKRFDEATLEDILNNVEGKLSEIRNNFLQGGKKKGDPSQGLNELIEELQRTPNVGPSLEGKIFNAACRGARAGCFYLKSASTSAGKTRTSVFDACHIAFPSRWSHELNDFIDEIDVQGEFRQPRKVLFIVTEMDKEELQTIMLAYLSGVNEEHILTGRYDSSELDRVKIAAKIIEKYHEYFFIEEISEPNLVNIEATIKRYVTVEDIKYIWFDYIHTTASLASQFSKANLREDVLLMMLANQLKQLAKDYGVFIFSATQVNMGAMMDDGEFKNETTIRGAKSISDKSDIAYVMTRVNEKIWNTINPNLKIGVRDGILDSEIVTNPEKRPTHIIDIYKMRRGRYKNVRIWTQLDLGNGRRKDLFITTADNQPISLPLDILNSSQERYSAEWRISKHGKPA